MNELRTKKLLVRIAVYIAILLIGLTMIFAVDGVWGIVLAAVVGISVGAASQWLIERIDKML